MKKITLDHNPNAAANAGPRDCQFCLFDPKPAVVDAKSSMGPWGYMCGDCLTAVGPQNVALVTNITNGALKVVLS